MSAIPDINEAVATAVANTSGGNTDTSAETGGCSDCQMCQKSPGLVILPVRYSAIAESHAHSISGLAPITSGGNFGEGVLDKAMQRATYILRSMRAGYFYMHFPSGDADGVIWRKYRVTSDSNFMPIPLDGHLTPNMEKSEACRRSSDWQMARCVTISQPEKVTQAWLAFSDTDWDESIRARIAQDPAARMQSLNPSLCISPAAGQPHTAPLSAVSDWVSEYRHNAWQSFRSTVADEDDPQNNAEFESVYPFHWRAFEADDLVETAERKSQGRAILFATHDPRGITVELNAEQIQAVSASLQRRAWRLTSWQGIQAIKAAVMRPYRQQRLGDDVISMLQADLEGARSGLELAQYGLDKGENPEGNRQVIDYYQKEIEKLERQIHDRIKDPEVLEKRGELAWQRTRNQHLGLIELDDTEYLRLSDEAIKKDIQQTVLADLEKAQTEIHVPLSQDHATWLKDDDLKCRFQCDYRQDDLDSGNDYAHHFIECIEDAADRTECDATIQQWVSQGNLDDTSNLLLRALTLNQDTHAAVINDLSKTPITPGNVNTILTRLNEAWRESRKHMLNPEASENTAKNAFARMIHQTGAPVAKFLSRQVDSAAMNLYLAAAMFSNEKLMIQRPLAGTPEQQLSFMAAKMRAQIPRNKRPSQRQMERIMRSWLATGGDEAVLRVPHVVLLDDKKLRKVADGSGAGGAAKARLLGTNQPIMLTPENIRDEALPRFQAWVNGDMRVAAVGLLFNTISTLIAWDTMEKANVFADEEAKGRFAACSAGLIGGVLEATEIGIKQIAAAKAFGGTNWDKARAWAERLGRIGRFFGAGAAWAFAYYDFKNMVDNYNKGNYWMMVLCFGSGAANTLLGFMSIFTSFLSGWAGLIFLIALGITLFIESLQDSAAQTWLKHCFYGSDERWPDIGTSDKELRKVLAG